MEEKKLDPYQLIGFVLIALIMTWMLMRQQKQNLNNQDKVKSESENLNKTEKQLLSQNSKQTNNESVGFEDLVYSSEKEEEFYQLENNLIKIVISNKGGEITKVNLKNFDNYLKEPLDLVHNNQTTDFVFKLKDGRQINTSKLTFQINKNKSKKGQLVMRAFFSQDRWIEFQYSLLSDSYLLDYSITSSNFQGFIDASGPNTLEWSLKSFRNSKSVEYENRYTELTYGYENDKVNELSITGTDEEKVDEIQWISYKQHFFNSILIPDKKINNVFLKSENLVQSEDKKEKYTKFYSSVIPLKNNGDFDFKFKWYFGPSQYSTLSNYNIGIEKSVNYGWGIFGWINKYIFIPLFNFISSFMPFGISIIIMTIIVRLAMSPVTYRSYVSQVKMKILRPEIEEINKKFSKDAVKRQQETMSLYSRAGANPMSGCLPALVQLPVFYALFSFFPVAFALRQKSFLWADDLSSYDSILDLPFNIPFYGDHISLFPILASVAIFIYTMMTMGQQQPPPQPGMPNMKFIMYLMPLMMLFFFNNYSSGLSLYYFVSNLLTIFLMVVIKNFVVNESKILLQIEENKKKPRKVSGFSARLQKAMEQAEKQKRLNSKR
ncbi:MAG: membrane protein insertase YidC [bacterium TMED80]|nr:MAG: membrane protein insertase YidC [bacterium TMED80]OUV05900.1 MAG: membrane protein insertase YidC [bacterium TMED80]